MVEKDLDIPISPAPPSRFSVVCRERAWIGEGYSA